MIKSIKDYVLEDFVKLGEAEQIELSRLLTYTKPIETKKDLFELKLKHVEELKDEGETNFEIFVKTIARMEGVKPKNIWKMRITEFFGKINYLKEKLKQLIDAEKSLSPQHTDLKWEAVEGSKRMAKFGIYNVLIPLAKQLNTTIEGVFNMEYGEVFTVRYYNAAMSDLHKEMEGIKLNTK